ncbi:MAG: hypothetical protein ACR2MO_09555 [Acidimicrobiales bacterium]
MSPTAKRSRRTGWKTLAAVALAAPLLVPAHEAGAAIATGRVSVTASGGQSVGGALTTSASVSADGQIVAFTSSATNLVPNDTNAALDVFVRNRVAGTTVRASVAGDGTEAVGVSSFPVISSDGRFVAYQSTAANLVADDTNGQTDIFVYDVGAKTTSRVSVITGGAQGCVLAGSPAACAGSGASTNPSINADGRFVAYQSAARYLATGVPAGDTNGQNDIFVTDRSGSITTTRASVVTGGGQGCVLAGSPAVCERAGASTLPSISGDGRFVSYTSAASYLVPDDTNAVADVFVTDRSGSVTTTRVSVATGGTQSTGGPSTSSSISANGIVVAFSSDATNLVAGDTNGATDVFAHDRGAGTTTRVSVATGGGQSTGGVSGFPSANADGRLITFDSTATNLVADDTNGFVDVFVHDRTSVATSRVSLGSGGSQTNAGSTFARISDDGRFVVYASEATNLVPNDTNNTSDVFITDRLAPEVTAGGYRLVANDGGIFAFGNARFLGSTGGTRLAQPIVGMATTPSKAGYWLVAADGGIFAFGDATFFGSTGALRLNKPIVGMAATATGRGYWLVASDGGIFAFGDAKFFGSTGAIKLNQPIVGMAGTPSGAGYFLVASDGGIFAFGDARFAGSTGATRLNKPIVGMAGAPSGGYWLVASDGGIFAFGGAAFVGSTGALTLNQPVVGMASTPSGRGYWLVASDGGIFAFGDATFFGSTGAIRLNQPIVGMTST